MKQRIVNRLTWDPRLEADDVVNVSVRDQVVKLTGIVMSWSGHREATRVAFDAGASQVVNSLTVREAPSRSQRTFVYSKPPGQTGQKTGQKAG